MRWLLYAAASGMLRLAAFRWLVLEPLRHEGAFVLLASLALRRAWGVGWWVEVVTLVLLATLLAAAGAEGRRSGWIMVALAALLFPLVPALSGHALAQESIRSFMVLNHALHFAGDGAWIGGLLLVLVVGLPAAREADVPA